MYSLGLFKLWDCEFKYCLDVCLHFSVFYRARSCDRVGTLSNSPTECLNILGEIEISTLLIEVTGTTKKIRHAATRTFYIKSGSS
jgi:hypothetical protein